MLFSSLLLRIHMYYILAGGFKFWIFPPRTLEKISNLTWNCLVETHPSRLAKSHQSWETSIHGGCSGEFPKLHPNHGENTQGLGGLKHFAHERPSLRWELMGAVLAVLFCRILGMEKGPWKNDVRKISSFGAITSFFITSPLLPVSSPHLLIFFVCCIFDWFVHVR